MAREEENRMGGEEKYNSIWVVDVEKMLAYDDPDSRRKQGEQWAAQSIYRVPEWLKRTNTKAYQPQLVSLGPLHHGDAKLRPMEEHKCRALVHLIKRRKKPLKDFTSAIKGVAEELKAAYGKDLNDQWRDDSGPFVEVMLRDGCFLLEIMSGRFQDYELHDPVFSMHGRQRIYPLIRSDMLLIENQLPLLVLKKILGVLPPDYPEVFEWLKEVEMDRYINLMVLKFLGREHEGEIANMSMRLHPLDLYHGSLTYDTGAYGSYKKSQEYKYEMMPSALEIHGAGIKFRRSNRDNLLDIRFKDGMLTMPVMRVDDSTESLYLNLMAFERLHAGAGDLVTAYVICMDNMIVSAKDVVMLSSKGLVNNMLGCDEEMAKLFNGTLSRGQLVGPCHRLFKVQSEVKAYCREPRHKWRATLIRTHFRNPWAFVSLAAAVILLIATLLQTVYTIMSNRS